MENLKNIIETRLKELGLGAVEAANRVGLERGYIRDFLEGRKKTFRQDKLPLLAQALDLDLSALVSGNALPAQPQQNAKIIGPVDMGGEKRIPVYGQAVCGVNGEFVLNGNVLYDVLCPPQLRAAQGAYAVVVSGDSMSPRYEDGEVAFVDPTRRVTKGDYVVAQIMMNAHDQAPQAFIKKFVRHNAEELVLAQFNPAKELRFPHDHVASVHYIALSGNGI